MLLRRILWLQHTSYHWLTDETADALTQQVENQHNQKHIFQATTKDNGIPIMLLCQSKHIMEQSSKSSSNYTLQN